MKTILFCYPPLSTLGDRFYFRTEQLMHSLKKDFQLSIIKPPSKTGQTSDRKFTFSKLCYFIFHLPEYISKIYRADLLVIFPSILWFFWIPWAKLFNKKVVIDHFTTTLYPEEFVNLPKFLRSFLVFSHRLIYPRIDLIITHTQTMKNHLAKFYRLNRKRIIPIYSLVDTQLFNPQKITKKNLLSLKKKLHLPLNKKIIFYHGKRHTFHGMKVLYDIADLSFKRNIKYIFLFLSQSEPKKNNRYFLPHVKFNLLYRYLALADLWLGRFSNQIQTQRSASSCMLQAMAMKIPVLTYKTYENSLIINNKKNGFIIKSLTPLNIFNSIDRILKQKKLLKKVGIKARKKIINQYSLKKWQQINKSIRQLTA